MLCCVVYVLACLRAVPYGYKEQADFVQTPAVSLIAVLQTEQQTHQIIFESFEQHVREGTGHIAVENDGDQ